MAVVDVLEWLERRFLRGELVLERGQIQRRFQVEAGYVKSASSNVPTEYLGQLLLNAGHLTEDTLRSAFDVRTERGLPLGKVLTVSGLVTESILHDTLMTKISESMLDALSWEEGAFAFEPRGASLETAEVDVAIALSALVTAGVERAEAWKTIRALIPSEDTRFFVPDPKWIERAKPGSPSALVLRDVVQGMTVREIILERHALPFPVYQLLADLLRRQIIQVADRAEAPRPRTVVKDAPSIISRARDLAHRGNRQAALDLCKHALDTLPDDEALKKLYRELERALFAELSRALLTTYRVPKLLKSPTELEVLSLSAEERYLVGRIDGRWDLLSLLRVSPLREAEALITFQRLAKRGVISLE
jgi:hypothetical protein